ncbi:hypothetical protein [Nonlabens arenilitoris]|nr:hypothetical protein [Nonlabens arenilitoris]
METKHLKVIQKTFGNRFYNKINVLHIADFYKYGSTELIQILNAIVCFDN